MVNNIEKQRLEKIRELGFLIFNLSVGRLREFPKAYADIICQMQDSFDRMALLRRTDTDSTGSIQIEKYGNRLNDKAEELGCLTFSSFVDKKTNLKEVNDLCAQIADLNSRINEASRSLHKDFDRSQIYSGDDPTPSYFDGAAESYPAGMEPIPINGRVCMCGYRNREYANFCGKCGAKL